MTDSQPTAQRVDKWLWHARFFRTRSDASRIVQNGIRINGDRTAKPATMVRAGDVLTFVQASRVRVIRVEGFADRRGNATLAQSLYIDLEPAPEPTPAMEPSGGRPSRRERQMLDRLRRCAP